MESLREDYYMNSNDLRETFGLSAPAMSSLFTKLNIQFAEDKSGKTKKLPPSEVRRILEARGYIFPIRANKKAVGVCKGGTGKTSTTFFTGIRTSSYGNRVLLIDADTQGNLTEAFDLEKLGFELTPETPVLLDVLQDAEELAELKSKKMKPKRDYITIKDSIVKVSPHLHLIPSTQMNSNLDNWFNKKQRNVKATVRNILEPIIQDYDYIIFDCAPSLSSTNASIFGAVDQVILPINGDRFSVIAIRDTLNEIVRLEDEYSFEVQKQLLFTRFDEREYVSKKYLGEVASEYGPLMYSTVIKQCADIKTAISKGEDLFSLSKKSSARMDYDSFTKEVMGLNKKTLRKRAASTPKVAEMEMH